MLEDSDSCPSDFCVSDDENSASVVTFGLGGDWASHINIRSPSIAPSTSYHGAGYSGVPRCDGNFSEGYSRKRRAETEDSGSVGDSSQEEETGIDTIKGFLSGTTRAPMDYQPVRKCAQVPARERTNIYEKQGLEIEEVLHKPNNGMETGDERSDPCSKIKADFTKFIMAGLYQKALRQRIVHDIIPARYVPEGDRYFSGSDFKNSRTFGGSIFIVANHGNDHYHVISYQCSTCCCVRLTRLRQGRKCPRKVVWSWDFDINHWTNLAIYLETDGRKICHLEVAGRNWDECDKVGGLSLQQNFRNRSEAMVEACGYPDNVSSFLDCRPQTSPGGNLNQQGSLESSDNSGNQKGNKGDQLLVFLQQYPTAPLLGIFKSKYRYMPRGGSAFLRSVLIILRRMWCVFIRFCTII